MVELDNTRQRIIEAAGPIFAEKGFEAATIREICQLAQANLAAVNYHFGDKEGLYLEVVRRAHQSRVEKAPVPNWAPGTPAETKLADFIRMLLTRMLSGGTSWHTQLMLREISRPNGVCAELARDYIRPQFELLLSILGELLPPEAPLVQRHLIAFSVVGQCLHYRVTAPLLQQLVSPDEFRTYDPQMLAEHVTHFTLSALGLRSAVAS